MGLATLLRYLIGDRRAIEEIASDRRALWLGFLFVLSAGFARDYDGEDLYHEPWHLLLPLAASLAASLVFFTLCFWKVLASDAPRPSFLSGYLSFLGLFWMTAPLAWLYAIPYERFLSDADAVRANLWTLGLVAAWRVALMIRVVTVVMGYHVIHAVFFVMAVADSLAQLAVWNAPGPPIIEFMGGIRHTEAELVLRSTRANVMFFGCLSLPVWLIGALVCAVRSKPVWQVPAVLVTSARRPVWGLSCLAIGSLLIWAVLLPRPQREQENRWRVEHLLKQGAIGEALAEMSRLSPGDFPPHWAPPSKEEGAVNAPSILTVMEVLVAQSPAPWVRALYLDKFSRMLQGPFLEFRIREEQVSVLAHVLRGLPEAKALATPNQEGIGRLLRYGYEMTPEDFEILRDLAGLKNDKSLRPPNKKDERPQAAP